MTGLFAGYSSIAASNAAQPVAFGRTMRRVVGVCVVVCVVEYLWYASYPEESSTWAEYAAARDTMVMLVVGFGFLMTFLRLYGLGAVGYTYLLTALVVLWAIPVEGFFERVRGMLHDGQDAEHAAHEEDEDRAASRLRHLTVDEKHRPERGGADGEDADAEDHDASDGESAVAVV